MVGPAADRTILVHGKGLGAEVTLEDIACRLAGQFQANSKYKHPLGHLVDRVKKGAKKKSERDSSLREVILLEAVSPTIAQAILQNPYDFGVPTTPVWLPSKEQCDESSKTGVVVIDYKQVLFTTHRPYLVEAIAAHVQQLTASTTKLKSYKDIFHLHVAMGQWAPSTWEEPATLIQWKRNGNRTINHYCVLTQSAYDALYAAGQQGTQTISVLAGISDSGKKLYTFVELEVGSQAEGGTVPQEVTNILSNLTQQLKTFNEELPTGIQQLRDLQLVEDEKTADRHRELLICLGSVLIAQKDHTETMVKKIQKATTAIEGLADALVALANVGGPRRAVHTWSSCAYVKVYNIVTAVYIRDPMAKYRKLQLQSDGKYFARGEAKITHTGKVVSYIRNDNNEVIAEKYTAQIDIDAVTETIVLTGHQEGTVGIWMQDRVGKPRIMMRMVQGHHLGPQVLRPDGSLQYGGVRGMKVRADKCTLLTAGADGQICSWDIRQTVEDQEWMSEVGAQVEVDDGQGASNAKRKKEGSSLRRPWILLKAGLCDTRAVDSVE
ncbi:hypothetical protein CYMTET_16335, partial [Cymbomonas tetramitiformis]